MKIIRSNKKGFRIHSPFVYQLVTSVLFADAEFNSFEEIEKFKISKKEKLQLKLLFRLLHYFQPEKVLCLAWFSDNEVQLMKTIFPDAGFVFPEILNGDEIQAVISACQFFIADDKKFLTNINFTQTKSVWFIKKNNKREKTGQFFQTLPEQENGRITIELENAGIVIVDNKFPSQDYVIKQRNLLPIYKKD